MLSSSLSLAKSERAAGDQTLLTRHSCYQLAPMSLTPGDAAQQAGRQSTAGSWTFNINWICYNPSFEELLTTKASHRRVLAP